MDRADRPCKENIDFSSSERVTFRGSYSQTKDSCIYNILGSALCFLGAVQSAVYFFLIQEQGHLNSTTIQLAYDC